MKKIILSGYIKVPKEEIDVIQSALQQHIALTLREDGCLVFKVDQRAHEPSIFNVYEEFSSLMAFETHQKRVANSDWGRISKNIERHYVVKEVD